MTSDVIAYHWFYAPTRKAALATLARVAGQRWQIEQAFQAVKCECGLDNYEVRHWQGWYRHMAAGIHITESRLLYFPIMGI